MGTRLDHARYCPRRSRRPDAADGNRFFRRLLRHPLCGGGSRAHLSAYAALAARGSSATTDPHLGNAGARLLITLPEGRRLAGLLRAQTEFLEGFESVSSLETPSTLTPLPQVTDPDFGALIQYTSGSTGDPKGVLLSHANLLANIRAIGEVMEASSADVFVSWLPLYHDMGLIGAWLGCMYFGAPLYVMSPLSFLVRPESWLWAMHRFRATYSASPNFGFALCLDKIPEADLQGLDLSSLRMIANGAEPVSAQTLRRFIDRFGRYGFPARAMAPVYGLAECSVGLAFPPLGRLPIVDQVDREQLSAHGLAAPASPGDPKLVEIVACGQPLPGHEIRIVDEAGHELGERQEGRLEFRGPSATRGYFHNEAKTKELIRSGWLDSGDRALHGGRRRLCHRPRQGHHYSRGPPSLSSRDRGGGRRHPRDPQGRRCGVWRRRSSGGH